MVGDVINLAARLMGKAKGRIVCDEVTRDLVRPHIQVLEIAILSRACINASVDVVDISLCYLEANIRHGTLHGRFALSGIIVR